MDRNSSLDIDGVASRVDAAIERALAEQRIVGAVVMVAQGGALVHRRAGGFADREAGRPMAEDTIFRLASITKPVVAAAAMRLVEERRLGLDDPVTRWLPEFTPRLADGTAPVITLKQLMTHTAGLGYRFAEPEGSLYHRLDVSDGLDQPGLSLAENLGRLVQAPLVYPPGTAWRYSLAMDVMGAVLEAATGQPLPEVVATRVTRPLGLADLGFTVTDLGRLAVPYVDGTPPAPMTDGQAVPLWEGALRFAPSRALDPRSYPSGGGGMAGTAGDVLRFFEAVRGGAILSAATLREMMTDQVGPLAAGALEPGWGFGLGWSVLTDPAAAATPQSRGTIRWGGVYGHTWFIDPSRDLTVVALTDTSFEGLFGAFPIQIRDAVYGVASGAAGPPAAEA